MKVYEEMNTPQTTVSVSLTGNMDYSTRNCLIVQDNGPAIIKELVKEEMKFT